MSSPGRSVFFMDPVDWHRRELIVELGDEFGGDAVSVMRVLRAMTKEQGARDHDVLILTGFRAVAREAFVSIEKTRKIIERAVEIKVLDDYTLQEDDRRFYCRVSGWRADQERGLAAQRKAEQRARDRADADETARDDAGQTVTDRDMSRGVTTEQSRAEESKEEQNAPAGATLSPSLPERVRYQGKPVKRRTIAEAGSLLELYNQLAGRDVGATTGAGKASPSLMQIIGALLARPNVAPDEWQAALRRTFASPPDWARERTLQIGDIFGPKAAEHALSLTDEASAGDESARRLAEKFEGRIR